MPWCGSGRGAAGRRAPLVGVEFAEGHLFVKVDPNLSQPGWRVRTIASPRHIDSDIAGRCRLRLVVVNMRRAALIIDTSNPRVRAAGGVTRRRWTLRKSCAWIQRGAEPCDGSVHSGSVRAVMLGMRPSRCACNRVTRSALCVDAARGRCIAFVRARGLHASSRAPRPTGAHTTRTHAGARCKTLHLFLRCFAAGFTCASPSACRLSDAPPSSIIRSQPSSQCQHGRPAHASKQSVRFVTVKATRCG